METRKVKKKKLSIKKLLIFLLCLYLIGCFIYYLIKLPIKNIYITGTSYLADVTIIEKAGIKNQPSILKTRSNGLEKKLKELDLVKNVKIRKNIFGKLTIEIEENNVLFYNRDKNKLVLEDKSEIEYTSEYYGIPTLVNFVPDVIYDSLIEGLNKIDIDTLRLISEIEYTPVRNNDVVIDETKFLLRMNDGNHVNINLVNIRKFNSYPDIYSTLDKKWILNMDSSGEESFWLEDFEKAKKEEKKDEE